MLAAIDVRQYLNKVEFGVSYDASDAHTIMTTSGRPVSSTKPRQSWATAHDSYRGFASGTTPYPTGHPGAGVLAGVCWLRMLHCLNRTSAKKYE